MVSKLDIDDCDFCGGMGECRDEEALNDGTEDFDVVECPECNGLGYKINYNLVTLAP